MATARNIQEEWYTDDLDIHILRQLEKQCSTLNLTVYRVPFASLHDSSICKNLNSPDDVIKLQSDLSAAAEWESDWLLFFYHDNCSVLKVVGTVGLHLFYRNKYLKGHFPKIFALTKNIPFTTQSQFYEVKAIFISKKQIFIHMTI